MLMSKKEKLKEFNRFELLIDLPKHIVDVGAYLENKINCDVVMVNQIDLRKK